MSHLAVTNRALAESVLAWETQRPATDATAAIEQAFRRLHDVMSPLVGSAGYRALLLRAIHLTKREHKWLDALVVSAPPFAIRQLDEQVAVLGAAPAVQGAATLFATLLDLFCAFIGEGLTLRQVHEAWVDLPVPTGDVRATPPKETK